MKNISEQKAMLDSAQARLSETFKALSGEALKSNNQAFIELADKSFKAAIAEARGDIGKRQEAIDSLIKPLAGSLERYEQQIKAMEQARAAAYGALNEQLKNMTTTQQQLQKETGNLVTALRTPQVRGRWGEMTLRRVVELAGMSEHCDYAEQVSVDSEEGKLRPDMVIHLHGDRRIVVDSKVSLEAYLKAISAQTEEERNQHLTQHAVQIRTHMQQLAGKQYWSQFEHTPELVVMFIPGESFFAAALDCDQSLLESGMQKRVVLATPTTLITLLWAVALGWRQDQMAENATAICELGRDLFERIRVLSSHIVKVGVNLRQTADSYNKAVGSMESRVMPSVRKFQELGAAGGEGIEVIEPLDVAIRKLNAENAGETDEE
ncbi:MAG: DNA recombination protein RmuC [Planctomycetaceae bacterium]|nr:MAG: DNA recombination protein RmuC [Planctomycetaceae bacterium]